jgi:NAD(P)-dependent dehydrogenase (short-subunit alcohol dehydrogenase family)
VLRLQDRVAIVTGATSGIGEAIAVRFAEEGARVVVAGRNADRGRKVASAVDGRFVECDVTREIDLASVVAAALAGFGRLDCFVGNAGEAGVHGSITELDEAGFDRTVAVLLKGVAFGMKHACRAMRAGGGGSIISTASGAALFAGMSPHIYSACKGAVVGLTRSVAVEEGAFGIRVNCICSGGVMTPILAKTVGVYGDEDLTTRINAAVSATVSAATSLGRIGLPADIAGAAAWLASDDSAYVTGQAVVVDGGETSGKALGGLPGDVVPTMRPDGPPA